MIRQIVIVNYRSIGAVTFDLPSFTCLVGANNAGKSNFVDALGFLSEVARFGLPQAIHRRGADSLKYFGAPAEDPVILEITCDAPKGSGVQTLTYTLGFHPKPAALEREIVNAHAENGKTQTILSVSRSQGTRFRKGDEEKSRAGFREGSLLCEHGSDDLGDAKPTMSFLNDLLGRIRVYRFAPHSLKAAGDAKHTPTLEPNGGNFASYLHHVQSANRRDFGRIEEQLQKSFPEIVELLTPLSPETDYRTEVGIREKWFDQLIKGKDLSDGLVGFLAHLTVIYGPDRPTLVCFEEPENYVNPRLLERLTVMFKEASSEVPIILTTHSTSLLNYLTLSDLRIVSRGAKGTILEPVADKTKLEHSLRGWALGDAYSSGAFENAA